MEIDEKYFEENALNLLNGFRGLESLEDIDWQKLRKSFAKWQIKLGGGLAIGDTALAPLLDAGDMTGQRDLIRKCKTVESQMYHGTISYMMGEAAINANSGESAADAIYVSTVSEEYKLVEDHLGGGEVKKQYLIRENGKPFDVLEVIDEEGSVQKFYFDVSDVMTLESLNNDYFDKKKGNEDVWGFLDEAYENNPHKDEADDS